MVNSSRKPWKKSNQREKAGSSRHLTDKQIDHAKERARKAGRRYPNLIDNMYEAQVANEKDKKKTPSANARGR